METSKINIYQLLVRLFGNKNSTNKPNGDIKTNGCGKFNDITPTALKSIKKLGVSHVWYTGIIEHASATAYGNFGIKGNSAAILKGKAGSPYSVRDYYDVSPDLSVHVPSRMQEFEDLLKRTHKEGLKAIIDFIPNHVSRAYKSDNKPPNTLDFGEKDNKDLHFHKDNNFYYFPKETLQLPTKEKFTEKPAKATGNDCFSAFPSMNDWYETVKLNYGVDYQNGMNKYFHPTPDTWQKMLDILLFWAKKGVDGFRCDMAEMVPVEFWEWVIPSVKKQFPNIIFIAEVYNPALYGTYIYQGKFDYLYDKVGMYDTVRLIIEGKQSASAISHEWQCLQDILDHMIYFIENHDEQRLASRFFADDPQKGIPATILLSCLSKNPFLIYSGQELGEKGRDKEGFSGEDGRTTIFDYWGVKSIQQWMNDGKFDGGGLTKKDQKLRKTYQNILSFSLSKEAISKGLFYDLQYANYENPHFDGNKLFAFIRHNTTCKILFVINFDNAPANFKLHIPKDAMITSRWDPNIKMKCTINNFTKTTVKEISLSDLINPVIEIKANCGLCYCFEEK